jgi:hypothetical protein
VLSWDYVSKTLLAHHQTEVICQAPEVEAQGTRMAKHTVRVPLVVIVVHQAMRATPRQLLGTRRARAAGQTKMMMKREERSVPTPPTVLQLVPSQLATYANVARNHGLRARFASGGLDHAVGTLPRVAATHAGRRKNARYAMAKALYCARSAAYASKLWDHAAGTRPPEPASHVPLLLSARTASTG